jgi:hypothetical protein
VSGTYRLTLFTVDGETLSVHTFPERTSFKYERADLQPMRVESVLVEYLGDESEDDAQPD